MTTVRFQADADLRQTIVNGTLRRQPSLDFRSAHAAGLEGKKDPEVLAIAAQEGRVLNEFAGHKPFLEKDRSSTNPDWKLGDCARRSGML